MGYSTVVVPGPYQSAAVFTLDWAPAGAWGYHVRCICPGAARHTHPSTNTQTYAVNLHAGSGPNTSAGTITVDGVSSGLLKVSSTNLVFKSTKVGKKVALTFKLQNAGPLHSSPLRIKINGPFTSFGLLAFKSQLPASSRATVAADGSVWLSLARGKAAVVTITFQPFSTLLVGDQLTISSNASGQPPIVVKFSGTGK